MIKQRRFKRRVSDCWCKSSVNLRSAFSPQLHIQTHGHRGGRSFIPAKNKEAPDWAPACSLHFSAETYVFTEPGEMSGLFPSSSTLSFCISMSHYLSDASKWTQSIGALLVFFFFFCQFVMRTQCWIYDISNAEIKLMAVPECCQRISCASKCWFSTHNACQFLVMWA